MDSSDIKIIVVDDEHVVNANLVAFLEDEGFKVFAATSGEEALGLMAKQAIDIGIIDMRLPGMDGNTLILKAHEMQAGMKFLIHTGSTNYVLPQSLIKIGMSPEQVFRKPLSDLTVLTRMINKVLFGDKIND